MNPDPLPPIQSPPAHHWRQFRVNILPHVTFGIVLLAVIWLWGRNLANPLLTGQAEGLEANVASPRAGRISHLNVVLYQEVKAGDVIAIVDNADPLILSNTLNLARAEMNAIRVDGGFRPTDKVNYAQLEFSWLNLRGDLASIKAQVAFAEVELQRETQLLADKLVSQEIYDLAKRNHETLQQSLLQKQEVVAAMEKNLKQLNPASTDESKYINAAIAVAEQNFNVAEAQLAPLKLVAPITGSVRSLSQLSGTTVTAGATIVTISSSEVKHIISYLSQPLRLEPKVGEKVIVRGRGLNRSTGIATITHIGPRVEIFASPLRVRATDPAQQHGLPFIMTVPANLKLLPGELVDLTLDTTAPLSPSL